LIVRAPGDDGRRHNLCPDIGRRHMIAQQLVDLRLVKRHKLRVIDLGNHHGVDFRDILGRQVDLCGAVVLATRDEDGGGIVGLDGHLGDLVVFGANCREEQFFGHLQGHRAFGRDLDDDLGGPIRLCRSREHAGPSKQQSQGQANSWVHPFTSLKRCAGWVRTTHLLEVPNGWGQSLTLHIATRV
jgi:hypothetical protein